MFLLLSLIHGLYVNLTIQFHLRHRLQSFHNYLIGKEKMGVNDRNFYYEDPSLKIGFSKFIRIFKGIT